MKTINACFIAMIVLLMFGRSDFSAAAGPYMRDALDASKTKEVTMAAKSDSLNTYNLKQELENPDVTGSEGGRKNALWLQAGLGLSYGRRRPKLIAAEWIHIEVNGHFRRNSSVFSIGLDGEAIMYEGIQAIWGTWGHSLHDQFLESSISVGFGFSRWSHATESEYGSIKSRFVPALVFRAQMMAHFPQVFGIGAGVTMNYSRESAYIAGSLIFAFGSWNW
jgi:hypothetical protein